MDTEAADIDQVAYLRAVAHPMRHRILAMLSERESSPGRLAATLGEKVNVVAYHVRRLHELGLIDLVEVRRGRGGMEHVYAAPRHLTFSDAAWEQLGPGKRTSAVPRFWSTRSGGERLRTRQGAGWKLRRRSSGTPLFAERTSCSTPAS